MKKACLIMLTSAGLALGGCISSEETVYTDVSRVKVEFEDDKAARIFYEALSKSKDQHRTESNVHVEIPIVFEHKRKVVTGENVAFNNAVARCDSNRDGIITEKEARIFEAIP